jgi:hypothetical protein
VHHIPGTETLRADRPLLQHTQYLVGQSIVVVAWVVFNTAQLIFKPFDPYPYILLNLGFCCRLPTPSRACGCSSCGPQG